MQIAISERTAIASTISGMASTRQNWWQHWRELANYIIPRRYVWLQSPTEQTQNLGRTPFIKDASGTMAARVLATGMLNGITPPTRPWFKLKLKQRGKEDPSQAVNIWLEKVRDLILEVMASSNFYNCMSTVYFDLAVFGTGAMIIYEDFDKIIRCYTCALGEYYIAHDFTQNVNLFAREFTLTVSQLEAEFKIENLSTAAQGLANQAGASRQKSVQVCHIVQPNTGGLVPKNFKYVEIYWEKSCKEEQDGKAKVLRVKGFNEFPGIFPRWELIGNEPYGVGPGTDALADIINLQHGSKRKSQLLDKMESPPLMATVHLRNQPKAFLPHGITYVQNLADAGAKPVYQVNPPYGEITMDLQRVTLRINDFFYNQLFRDIQTLETVRSAREIDARQEEKLLLLGSVLDRFKNEALDPAVNRIYSILERANLLPEIPEGIEENEIEIQYTSVLFLAQQAISVAPIERAFATAGNLASVIPSVLNVLKADEAYAEYCKQIGVPAKLISTPEELANATDRQNELVQQRETAAQGTALAKSAQLLSKTEVGGGQNAVELLLGQ